LIGLIGGPDSATFSEVVTFISLRSTSTSNIAITPLIYCVYNPEFTMASAQSRSSQLSRLQARLDGELVTSEMRTFCELCDIEYLEQLANMSKGDLITLSNNCKDAVLQWTQSDNYEGL